MITSVDADELSRLATAILEAHSVPTADAELLADSLVQAELWGHSSHGMLRLPWYTARLRSGAMQAVTDVQTVSDTGSLTVLDGQEGIGQVIATRAVTTGIAKAMEHGISGVAVRNSNHFGTAAYFTRRCADEGMVGILATNASPAMAPWGGRQKMVGNNPWSIAVPAGRYSTVVMDIANTAVARGKIYLARERGQSIPEGWAADSMGVPTTDADAAIDGLILPMGGHKGYVISFMLDILAGVLTGSSYGTDVAGPYQPEARSGCGHLLLTIDIERLMPRAEFEQRMEDLLDRIKGSAPAEGITEVFFPGEIEARNNIENRRSGLAIPDRTLDSLRELAASSGVEWTLAETAVDATHLTPGISLRA